MGMYRKKPVVIEAHLLTHDSIEDIAFWSGSQVQRQPKPSDVTDVWTFINIPTLEGIMRGDIGDYIIKGVKGEFYACKQDVFELTYEEV
jgi:hypothetical protein